MRSLILLVILGGLMILGACEAEPEAPSEPTAPPPTAAATNTPVPPAAPTDTPLPPPAPTDTPVPPPAATDTPAPTPVPPTDTPTPSPTPEPTTDEILDAAFERINTERADLGLSTLRRFVAGDDSFIDFAQFRMGCDEPVANLGELQQTDVHALGLTIIEGISECGIIVDMYDIVPMAERMRVDRETWDCFTDSKGLHEPSDVSCGGRFTGYSGLHERWMPDPVAYYIAEGASEADTFSAYIPWIREKLRVAVEEAQSEDRAHLILYLGAESPQNCAHRLGCSIVTSVEDRTYAEIWVSAQDDYFGQVLKHELLHAILPMGHLPPGNYLMSVRPDDPSQTHTLSELEERLLRLYTHPYLRVGMSMEQFRRYLVIEG